MYAPIAQRAEGAAPLPLWADLIAAIARGDQSALADFYDHTHRLVFGLLLRLLPERALAEEVLVEVYQQVWQQAVQFDPRHNTPLTWLMMLARRRALDRLRASTKQGRGQGPLTSSAAATAAHDAPEDHGPLAQQRHLARAALSQLSPEQREAIEIACYTGLSYPEIAAQLGLPPGAIRLRIYEGMCLLKNHLQPAHSSSLECVG